MVMHFLILLIFVATCNCTFDNQVILFQISSGENVCNNEKLFRNFKFSDTHQLGAMCNIPVPNKKQVDILLENDAIPILCMGVYDVSLRLCNEAANNTLYFKDVFPPSTEQFTRIFNTLKQTEEYSDLNKFCSVTVKKNKITESASSNTKFWWDVLSTKLNNEDSCKGICNTNEISQVHPLCSYIIWLNDIILNHRRSLVESEAKELEVPVESLLDKNEMQPDRTKTLGDELDSPVPSGVEMELPFTNVALNSDPVLVPSVIQNPSQTDSSNVKPNSTNKSTNFDLGNSEQPIEVSEKKGTAGTEILTAKSVQNTSSDSTSSSNQTGTPALLVVTNGRKPIEVTTIKENDKNKSPGTEVNLNSAGAVKTEKSKTDVADKDQTKAVEIAEVADQNDFNDEIDLDSVPSDPPAGSDTGTRQQFEEIEDADEEGIIGENPEKPDTKKNGLNSDSSNKHDAANDQGKPDELYSEVDRTVLIEDPFIEAEDSHFFTYFLCVSVLTIMAYLAFHNKNKLMALAVEGRKSKSSRRRPNSSNYSKLDCSLEEAMVSNTTASVTHVLY